MRLFVKLGVGSTCAFLFVIIVGFITFPKMIKSTVKKMVAITPGNDIRDMFLRVPFALEFKVYLFNITNPMDVQNGKIPSVQEIGPFCYQEWKEKVDVKDLEGDDEISYNQKDTFIKQMWPGCLSGEEVVTIPHPMILGVVNAVIRQKPGALSLVNKAIKSIYSNPTSIFVTAKANEILFDGIEIRCGVTDFAGKAICSQFKAQPSLRHINEEDVAFALLAPKNATLGKRIKAYRGSRNYKNLGKIVEFDGAQKMDVWPTEECNKIRGTDGTIFPPFLLKEEGLVSFAPDLCRSLSAFYVRNTKYDGIPVREYSANLGDMSRNANEKCYCLTSDKCLQKGVMDLYKCIGVPIYASLPHFYEADESYVRGVKGLAPDKYKHEIKILFEATTGSPVYAKKRLQFNMPLESNTKVELFHNFSATVIPLFWIEEGVELNNTFTKPLKAFFRVKKVVNVSKWLILMGSLCGCMAACYFYFKENEKANITPMHKVQPISKVKSNTSINENYVTTSDEKY